MRLPAFLAAFFVAAIAHAAAPAPPIAESAQRASAAVPAPGVAAQSYFLLDTLSGQTLASSNAGAQVAPATEPEVCLRFDETDSLRLASQRIPGRLRCVVRCDHHFVINSTTYGVGERAQASQ